MRSLPYHSGYDTVNELVHTETLKKALATRPKGLPTQLTAILLKFRKIII